MGVDSRDSYMLGWNVYHLVYLKKIIFTSKSEHTLGVYHILMSLWVHFSEWCIFELHNHLIVVAEYLQAPKWRADIALTAVQGKAWGRAKLAFLGEMKAAGRNSGTICCWPFWENLSSWVCFLKLSVILFIELKFVYLRTMWFQAVCSRLSSEALLLFSALLPEGWPSGCCSCSCCDQ